MYGGAVTRSARDETWALVPVNRFDLAKSRLAEVLGPAERSVLARAMLEDVLEQIARSARFAGVLVVTCDAQASAIARDCGAQLLVDRVESGTNEAVLQGLASLDAPGKTGVVIVPSDIPFVNAAELQRVLLALESGPIVIAPAARDGGTNILALSPPRVMAPAFGPDSFARHIAAAQAIGLRPTILKLEGAAHDIDVAADLVIDSKLPGGVRTRACLPRFRIGPQPVRAARC